MTTNGLHGIGMTSQRTRARMIERLREKGIRNEAVLRAMAAVPRHVFVEEALASRAYEDTALPLGLGQTISQPFVVARMIELLLNGRATLGKTLEVGAGCGYQAAVLAQLTSEVYSLERLAPLLEKAGVEPDGGVMSLGGPKDAERFLELCTQLRFWEREPKVHCGACL